MAKDCLENIECRFVYIVTQYNIVVLEGVAANFDSTRKEKATFNAVGDGIFIVAGRKINRNKMMYAKFLCVI